MEMSGENLLTALTGEGGIKDLVKKELNAKFAKKEQEEGGDDEEEIPWEAPPMEKEPAKEAPGAGEAAQDKSPDYFEGIVGEDQKGIGKKNKWRKVEDVNENFASSFTLIKNSVAIAANFHIGYKSKRGENPEKAQNSIDAFVFPPLV